MSSFEDAIAYIAEIDPQKAEDLKALHKAEQAGDTDRARVKAEQERQAYLDNSVATYLNHKNNPKLKGKSI